MTVNYVGSGSGGESTTPPVTIQKTNCTKGNLIVIQAFKNGTTGFLNYNSITNLKGINGTNPGLTTIVVAQVGSAFTSIHEVRMGRVVADGTASLALTRDTGTDAVAGWMHEFSNIPITEGSPAYVFEGGDQVTSHGNYIYSVNTSATVTMPTPFASLGPNRLGLVFVCLDSDQALGNFSGESGADFTELVAEFRSAALGMTMGVQYADLPTLTAITGGSIAITSAPWSAVGIMLKPIDSWESGVMVPFSGG